MFDRVAPLALVTAATALLVVANGGFAAGQGLERPPTPPDADIRQVYLRDCAVCHGAGAGGTDRGPSLAGMGPALIDYTVSTGRMPIAAPHEQIERQPVRYPRAVIDGLVAYVDRINGPGGVSIPDVDLEDADVARGGEIYRLQCAACHAWAGDGGALADRQAPAVHPATPVQAAEAIRAGPGTMPAFGLAAVDEEELNDLVAYVEYLKDPEDRGGLALGHLGPLPEGAVAWILGLGLLVVLTRWIGETKR